MLNKILNILYRQRFLIISILLVVLTYHIWLFSFDIFSTGDWGYFSAKSATSYLNPSSWSGVNGYGGVDDNLWRLPLNYLYGLFGFFGAPKNVSEKIIVFWPSVILAASGSYLIVSYYFGKKAGMIGSIVFNLNTYYLISSTHFLLYSAAAVSTYSIFFYIKAADTRRTSHFVISGLLLSVASYLDIRLLYLNLIIFGLLAINELFLKKDKHSIWKKLIPFILKNSLLLLVTLLLLAFWILGVASAGSLTGNGVLGRDLFGDQYWNLLSAILLHHPFWTGSTVEWFTSSQPPLTLWIIPLLVFLSILVNKRNRIVVVFTILSILGILLAKQTEQPFSNLYAWLYNNVPGFNAFREATKFYYFIALGYAVILGGLVSHADKNSKRAGNAIVVIIGLVFMINALPSVTGELDDMRVKKSIDSEYSILNKKIKPKDDNPIRILWLPISSRWFENTSHVSSVTPDYDNMPEILSLREKLKLYFKFDKYQFSNTKYLVLEKRNAVNKNSYANYGDDRNFFVRELDKVDWLERVDFGTEDLIVYENSNFKPYFSSLTSLAQVPELSQLEEYYDLQTSLGVNDFSYTDSEQLVFDAIKLSDMFRTPGQVEAFVQSGVETILINGLANHQYKIEGNTLSFFTSFLKPDALASTTTIDESRIPAGSVTLSEGKEYFAYENGDTSALQIDIDSIRERGLGKYLDQVDVYSADTKPIISEEFNNSLGVFAGTLKDCNPYNDSPIIGAELGEDANGSENQAMLLSAARHTACVDPSGAVDVSGKESVRIGFDYKQEFTKQAGYIVTFDGADEDAIHQDIYTNPGGWRRYETFIEVPEGAQEMRIQLLGFPDETRRETGLTFYDNFVVSDAQKLLTLEGSDRSPRIIKEPISSVRYIGEDQNQANLISNPSFEEGLWKEEVGDCNAYDDNPKLDMKLNPDSTDGSQSLQLEAARHIACTSLAEKIQIQEGKSYVFSFDYRSENGKTAGYYISFNDSQKTSVSERIDIDSQEWNTFSKSINAPYGATEADIVVYSYSDETTGRNIVTKYDNFDLHLSPDLSGMVYSREGQDIQYEDPQSIDFIQHNPTKKYVSIKGARTSFYLAMSESYHPKWKADKIPDGNHFELNGWQNGWFVDVDDLCVQRQLCEQNEDGSWNIDLTIEFTPQKWFYVGSVISGTTFVGIVGYLGYDWRKGRRKKSSGASTKNLKKDPGISEKPKANAKKREQKPRAVPRARQIKKKPRKIQL